MRERADEILEQIWVSGERGEPAKASALQGKEDEPFDDKLLAEMAQDGLLTAAGDVVSLTDLGRQRAAVVIRRHRLAERLMKDVLEMKEAPAESAACEFEHMLPVDVMESICILLGHPTHCPHGHAIPPGDCCRNAVSAARPVVTSLSKMKTGGEGTVAYIATQHHQRLDKLAAFGLLPGVKIRLHQRHPSFVIQMGETTLAIDEEIATDIYVRQAGG